MKDDFLDASEVAALGLSSVGRAVQISRHALLFDAERISIGDHTRIDAFCILSAGVRLSIGRNVHIAAYVSIHGRSTVDIGDFAGLSTRCTIYSSNDDYGGATMLGPTVPDRFRGAIDAAVVIGPHAVLGAGTIVLPGVTVGESASVGALSLVKGDVAPFTIVAGIPARVIGERRHDHRRLAVRFLEEEPDRT